MQEIFFTDMRFTGLLVNLFNRVFIYSNTTHMKRTTIKLLTLLLCLLAAQGAYAQGEAAYWYFGHNSGMNFNSMSTVTNAIVNGVSGQTLSGVPDFETGPIDTGEGCFTISGGDGDLLLASDGRYVYNKNRLQMPHGEGLQGHASATQSGIIIPRPNHPDRYYIVTTLARESSPRTGIYYYEVDMTLDGGLGDVVGPYTGNVPNGTLLHFGGVYPTADASENIAAVGHSDGKQYWLVQRCRNHFFVWLVTEDGIAPTPTASYAIGFDPNNILSKGDVGYTKFSSDGQYIANMIYMKTDGTVGGQITVGRFDNSNGTISGIRIRDVNCGTTPLTRGYCVQFSPKGEYLYYTFYYIGPLYRLSTQSLLNGTAENPVKILDYVNNIQIGTDFRLYGISSISENFGVGQGRNLFIVLNPDDSNPDTAVIPDYFPAVNGSHLSLPTFTSSFFSANEIEIDPSKPCVKSSATFSVQLTTGSGINRVTRLDWDFGDGTPVVSETNMNQAVFVRTHTYAKTGTYRLTLTPYKSDGTAQVDKIQSIEFKVNPCVMPVNPNIHLY